MQDYWIDRRSFDLRMIQISFQYLVNLSYHAYVVSSDKVYTHFLCPYSCCLWVDSLLTLCQNDIGFLVNRRQHSYEVASVIRYHIHKFVY